MTDKASASVRAPHSERNPPVTLRKITLGRRARSQSLLVAGTSRRVMKTKRSPRHWRIPRASFRPASAVGLTASKPVEPAVEVGAVLDEGGVLQLRAPLADGDGAAQEHR